MPHETPPDRLCDDNGICHHNCDPANCYRHDTCAALTPTGEWPAVPTSTPATPRLTIIRPKDSP